MTLSTKDRRRYSNLSLKRALGAACFAAGATALTSAFAPSPPSVQHGLCTLSGHKRISDARYRRSCERLRVRATAGGGGSGLKEKRNGGAVPHRQRSADPSGLTAAGTGRAHSGGHLQLPQKPPLSPEEERTLINQIQQARVLRSFRRRLLKKGGGDKKNTADARRGALMPPAMWAREAGITVEELTEKLQAGIEAKEALVERNLPMVIKIVRERYQWRLHGGQVTTADLVQEGAYALGLAAERFDADRDTRFLTYAVFVVRDKLDNALASGNSAISVPASALKEYYEARRQLTAELGRQPLEPEFANFFTNEPFTSSATSAADDDDGDATITSNNVQPTTGLGIAATTPEQGLSEVEVEGGKGARIKNWPLTVQDAATLRRRKRRLDLLAAVQRSTSLDTPVKGPEGGIIPLVEVVEGLGGKLQRDPLLEAEYESLLALLPKVLTPRQVDLVRMACGFAEDGRSMSMQECSQRLCLSVSRTKELFEASLQELRASATLDHPSVA